MKRRPVTKEKRLVWLLWYADRFAPTPRPSDWAHWEFLDTLNSHLVDDYAERLHVARQFMMIGAHRCSQLAADLRELWKRGYMTRWASGVGGLAGMGFPKWIWMYKATPEGIQWYSNKRKEGLFMTRAQLTDTALASIESSTQMALQLATKETRAQAELPMPLKPRPLTPRPMRDVASVPDDAEFAIESPFSMPEFQSKISPWFTISKDGTPSRPGVFLTKRFMPKSVVEVYSWRLWTGIAWMSGQRNRSLAKVAEAPRQWDDHPTAWCGLSEPPTDVQETLKSLGVQVRDVSIKNISGSGLQLVGKNYFNNKEV